MRQRTPRIVQLLFALSLVLLPVERGGTEPEGEKKLPPASLEDHIAQLKKRIPAASSERFVEPSEKEIEDFAAAMKAMLEGDAEKARACLAPLGYDLTSLEDKASKKVYLVAEEHPDGIRGLGFFIVDPRYKRNVVVGIPHPLYDIKTPEEGRAIFEAIGARALFIAGTHRCANAAASRCQGTTEACGGGAFKVSDAGHNTRTFFQASHRAALSLAPPAKALSLHGQSQESVDVVVSDGTGKPAPPGADVLRLREALLARGVSAGSCNSTEDEGLRLCGTTNVQGRLYNGSSDPCTASARKASGLFLHIEQKRAVRDDPSRFIEALEEILAIDRPGGTPAGKP